jgi:hypothetical protein
MSHKDGFEQVSHQVSNFAYFLSPKFEFLPANDRSGITAEAQTCRMNAYFITVVVPCRFTLSLRYQRGKVFRYLGLYAIAHILLMVNQ